MAKVHYPVRSPKVTSPYGWRTDPITGARQYHNGIDFVSSFGDLDCIAIADGTVVMETDYYNPGERYNVNSNSSIGRFVILSHVIDGTKYYSKYCHLDSNRVTVGDKVQAGDVIGVLGTLGYSTGVHLHLSIYDASWNAIDPMTILPK